MKIKKTLTIVFSEAFYLVTIFGNFTAIISKTEIVGVLATKENHSPLAGESC